MRVVYYGQDAPCIDIRCPECGRFMQTKGSQVVLDGDGNIKRFEGVICRRHGEIQPAVMGWYGDFFEEGR